MTTSILDPIVSALFESKFKYEIFSNLETRRTWIGVNFTKHNWYWFTFISIGTIQAFEFEEQYSQNTGKSNKGIRNGFRALTMFDKKLKQDFVKWHVEK